jgi:hypothetical protein
MNRTLVAAIAALALAAVTNVAIAAPSLSSAFLRMELHRACR